MRKLAYYIYLIAIFSQSPWGYFFPFLQQKKGQECARKYFCFAGKTSFAININLSSSISTVSVFSSSSGHKKQPNFPLPKCKMFKLRLKASICSWLYSSLIFFFSISISVRAIVYLTFNLTYFRLVKTIKENFYGCLRAWSLLDHTLRHPRKFLIFAEKIFSIYNFKYRISL